MAGHCISGDVVAHSNYRVTGNAAIMGQAYGKVAAIAILANRPEEAIITGVFLLTVFHTKFQVLIIGSLQDMLMESQFA